MNNELDGYEQGKYTPIKKNDRTWNNIRLDLPKDYSKFQSDVRKTLTEDGWAESVVLRSTSPEQLELFISKIKGFVYNIESKYIRFHSYFSVLGSSDSEKFKKLFESDLPGWKVYFPIGTTYISERPFKWDKLAPNQIIAMRT